MLDWILGYNFVRISDVYITLSDLSGSYELFMKEESEIIPTIGEAYSLWEDQGSNSNIN